jgi:hypothetical protein
MTDRLKPEPGTRARLIREGLEHHPQLSPEELAGLLNERHRDLGIEFRAEDIRHTRHILREPVGSTEADPLHGYQPLFSDRLPPVRALPPELE